MCDVDVSFIWLFPWWLLDKAFLYSQMHQLAFPTINTSQTQLTAWRICQQKLVCVNMTAVSSCIIYSSQGYIMASFASKLRNYHENFSGALSNVLSDAPWADIYPCHHLKYPCEQKHGIETGKDVLLTSRNVTCFARMYPCYNLGNIPCHHLEILLLTSSPPCEQKHGIDFASNSMIYSNVFITWCTIKWN